MASEVKLSSKGQVVLPSEIRKKLGLKKGDKLKVEIDEGNNIVMHSSLEPPKEIFIHAGTKLTSQILNESAEIDEAKVKNLLKAIGAH